MIDQITVAIQNINIPLASETDSTAKLANGAIVQISKKDSFFFAVFILKCFSKGDYPFMFPIHKILHMRGRDDRRPLFFIGFLNPFQFLQCHVFINFKVPVVNNVSTFLSDNPNIYNVISGFHDRAKLCGDSCKSLLTFTVSQFFLKEIIMNIFIRGNQYRNIVQIINVRIDITVHLLNQLNTVFFRIFQNSFFRILQCHHGKYRQCHHNDHHVRCHNGAANTVKSPYETEPFPPNLFHYLLISFAYSVGVLPTAFLKATLK